MCAGNVQCKECAAKAQMGMADNILTPLGLGGLIGEQGLQTKVIVEIQARDDFWLKLGGTVIAIVLLSTVAYYGIKKILKV